MKQIFKKKYETKKRTIEVKEIIKITQKRNLQFKRIYINEKLYINKSLKDMNKNDHFKFMKILYKKIKEATYFKNDDLKIILKIWE